VAAGTVGGGPGSPLVTPERYVTGRIPAGARPIAGGRPIPRVGRSGWTMVGMNPLERVRPGTLLVAAPSLVDPNFRRTVVYLIAHGEEGTVGVVLNRPSETAVFNVLPGWAGHASRPPAVYVGGPVQTSAAMCLGVCRAGVDADALPSTARVTGPVVLVDLDAEPDEIIADLKGLRIFAGHAGWGAAQLSEEIAEGAWHVLDGLPDDVLAGPRVDLWFRVLRRQPMPLTLEAYHPGDLSRN
jgi:putative transcriptional regulator